MYNKLEKFLNYKPIFSEKEIDEFFEKEVKQPVINYLGEKEGEMLQKAYEFTKKSHGDEKRLSGEPYIVHPVYVAKYLLMIKPGIIALQAALLHDVIEDTPVSPDEIEKHFGPEVKFLCLGLEKVSKVRYQGEDRQIETLKKTFLAMGHDIRVIFIKLADRIHNIQTLKYHPKREKQERIANETLKIYAPIAKRLGIEVFQLYLENGAFAILNPQEFQRIADYIKKKYGKTNIDKLKEKLEKLLKDNNIKFLKIKGRLKSPYRVYKKFQKYNTVNIDEIKDILAFRIIVKDIPSCYTTLGIIHSKYTPIIKRIKDYISIPKPNGYQSLHTTILGLYKTPVEIQIRTKEMDQLAEYGVAAHFIYKEIGSQKVSNKQIEWVNRLKEISKEYQEKAEKNKVFFNVLDIDFLRKSVFVYTPSGKVIELPKGGTVLDFAFRVHTDIGLRFKSALVNGKIVSIDHPLRNGDIVEIKTFKNQYSIKKSWLDYVISPTSKNKIRQYLNLVEKEKYIESGKNILNELLQKYHLPELFSKNDKISKGKKEEEINRILVQIHNKNINPTKLLKQYYPEIFKNETKKTEQKDEKEENIKDKVIIDNSSLFKYSFCPECKPKKGDKIIGKVTQDGVKIHKTNCKALKNVNYQKLVEAHWDGEKNLGYEVKVIFDITDKKENMISLLNIIQDLHCKILNVNTVGKNNKCLFEVKIYIKIPTRIHLLKQKLKKEYNHLFNKLKIEF